MPHLDENDIFKSDKYDWCPPGFFPLKFTDPRAQTAILLYAGLTDSAELRADLKAAVKAARKSTS